MVQQGHDVSVYSTDPTGKLATSEELNGVHVHRFKSFAPHDSYFLSPSLYQSLQTADCDVIHGHDLNGFPLFAGALAKGSKKYFATLHVGAFSSQMRTLARVPYNRIVMHRMLQRAEKIICVSEYERTLYQTVLGLPNEKFVVIPNGYDPPTTPTQQPTPSGRFVLSVGRLEKSKGFHYLIQSFALLKTDPKFRDVTLVIVGKGPYETQLRQLIQELRLQNHVRLRQNVPRNDPLALYAQCTLFVLLSNYESQGLAVWDAFAFQKPVLTSTAAVLGEYAQNGYSIGVSLPPNITHLANKIKEVLSTPERFVPPKFAMPSWTEVALTTLNLYKAAFRMDDALAKVIYFFGPDGSGKTTLATKTVETLSKTASKSAKAGCAAPTPSPTPLPASCACTPLLEDKITSWFPSPKNLTRLWRFLEFTSALPVFFYRFALPKLFGFYVVGERYLPDYLVWVSIVLNDDNFAQAHRIQVPAVPDKKDWRRLLHNRRHHNT
jgi:glycosyltransferase involved in cell wall biosynthesis